MEDEKIVERYLARDESAVALTAEKYGRRLRALSFGIVRDPGTAEECENDTYLAAWNSIPPNEPRDCFYGYLARIIRNVSLSRCRESQALKRGALVEALSREMERCIPAPNGIGWRMDELALKQTINGFLRTQSELKRNVFIRRYWYLDDLEDIGARYGISKSNVKIILFRVRRGLRECLEKEGYTL